MRRFTYIAPTSREDAFSAFAAAGEGARWVAGGTNIYDLMKLDIERPAHLIDVTAIEGLDAIETGGEMLRFGTNARMADVAANETILRDYPVLSESLWKAASQQLRNMATVGANLLQRTRCLYFRNGAGGASGGAVIYPCNRREPGSGCAAIGGIDRGQAVLGASANCTAVSPGDWPVALTAMDAQVELAGPQGARAIPIAELYRLPGETPQIEFTLGDGEMITGISVPKTRAGRRSTYHKVRDRESYAFALASAAVALDMDGDTIRKAHVALGGVATVPWRSPEAEAVLAGKPLTEGLAEKAARAAFAEAKAGKLNGYKIDLGIRTLVDALSIAAERNS
ncbi:FAD binding domain-containing protein [Novosphingobium aquimarinum]|uniref:FAD binding domain-containing protein n=1 Tax=Novosphingobium aquimarinum TaxID=2682494 RepID=UPI0012EB4630|nr:xanthine dehydrogenase family protein subunit M [Novosphingobium aquimarinum]